MNSLCKTHDSLCWMALMVCLFSRETDEIFVYNLCCFITAKCFSQCLEIVFSDHSCLVLRGCSYLHTVLRVKIKLYNLYVCKASFFSCPLQEHSTTCVRFGLLVLDTVLAVEYSFFSKAEGGALKLDCVTANRVLPVKFWTFLL